jgi:hypothetical protein
VPLAARAPLIEPARIELGILIVVAGERLAWRIATSVAITS